MKIGIPKEIKTMKIVYPVNNLRVHLHCKRKG